MDQSNFNDPRRFVPDLLDYIDLSRVPRGVSVPASARQPLQGLMKVAPDCSDFIVLEPVGDYPGMPDTRSSVRRYLSAGPESDMPGLRTDVELFVTHNGRRVPAIAFTAYKWGTGTWPVQDAVAKGLTQQLGRYVNPNDVIPSGLKDRRGRTVQRFSVPGVSLAEAKRVDWSRVQWNAQRSGFIAKDVGPTDKLNRMGSHGANFFDVRVRVPGKTGAELEEYMAPRALWLAQHDYLVPNYFHRQRLGPGQNMQRKGYVLLTGDYKPEGLSNPLMTNVEAFFHSLLFEPTGRDSRAVRELREDMEGQWQFNFEEMERMLRRVHRRYNLSLEYEVVRRLADTDKFGGCCEAILYDLRNRLSLCVGAWQAFYWNWELQSQIRSNRLSPQRNATIPLPMSCEDSKRTYRRTPLGQQCLSELEVTERQASGAEEYMEAYIRQHWAEVDAEVEERRKTDPAYRPHREALPDDQGLSFDLVRKMFSSTSAVDGLERPSSESLSAALVKRLYLVPRYGNGSLKDSAPRRKAFTRAEGFEWSCDDETVRVRTALRSGSYFTTLAGALFNTTDPEEELETPAPTEGEVA